MSKKSEFHFFAFLSRMKYINRWGLMRNTQPENIQEHSIQVAMIAHGLAVIKNTYFGGSIDAERVAVLSIYHDASETITGDMPTPIKYFSPEISRAYNDVEKIANEKLLSMLPEEVKEHYRKILFKNDETKELWELVKAADRISAYIKCIEEEKAGNKEFKKAADVIYKSIRKLNLPEVKYFIDNIIPTYKLTLDELD